MIYQRVDERIRICDYLSVAQIFLQSNFFLERKLEFSDIKPRLLGHWGTCHGINMIYANTHHLPNFQFILGPGHGFPALQANLFLDGELAKVDQNATINRAGVEYISKQFSWPNGFPSHASPSAPNVISEGGELGYALATAYGAALSSPEKNIIVVIGDGEFETGTALASMNLVKLIGQKYSQNDLANDKTLKKTHGTVLPFLHLNGYKISGPTIAGRKSEHELKELIRGFGFTPILIKTEAPRDFRSALEQGKAYANPFFILKTEKGASGPTEINGAKVSGNYLSHQVPLKNAKTDPAELALLETWLKSYDFTPELFKHYQPAITSPAENPANSQNHPTTPQKPNHKENHNA